VSEPIHIVQAAESRSARVESLRALAATGVLVGHVYGVTTTFDTHGFVHRLGLAGGYGVWLFFALSGYLLFLPFARRDYGDGGPIDLGRYALNRALRILPLYYVVLVVLLVVQEGGGSLAQWLRFGTFTPSFFSDTVATVDGPMWSLLVELQFYALLPPIAWLVLRVSRGRARGAMTAVAALGLVSLLVWYLQVHRFSGHGDDRWRYSLLVSFAGFTPGMLLALVRVRIDARERRLRLPPPSLLLLASIPFWLLAAYRLRWSMPLCLAGSALVLASVVLPGRDGPLVRALDWRPLAALGVASYSLYLWHLPVVAAIGRHMHAGFPTLLLVAVPTCIAIAAVSYRVVERPFLRLRRRWGPTAATARSVPDPPAVAVVSVPSAGGA
jgi:peptidoglycan/LPS O-acetylase OafA/YrhL